jgi:hypothetical protein
MNAPFAPADANQDSRRAIAPRLDAILRLLAAARSCELSVTLKRRAVRGRVGQ